jgi:hypothetical protein
MNTVNNSSRIHTAHLFYSVLLRLLCLLMCCLISRAAFASCRGYSIIYSTQKPAASAASLLLKGSFRVLRQPFHAGITASLLPQPLDDQPHSCSLPHCLYRKRNDGSSSQVVLLGVGTGAGTSAGDRCRDRWFRDWRWDWRWDWNGIDILNRGTTGRSNFVDGILRGLTESIVARTTNLTVHYVGAATHVLGAADVPVS